MIKVFMAYLTPGVSSEEHLGTASIAAYLEKHSVPVILKRIPFEPVNPDIEKMFLELPEDVKLFGFPLFNTNAEVIYHLAKKIKERDKECKIFVGGRLATDAYDLVLKDCEDIDFIVLGDGEVPVWKVVEAMEAGEDLGGLPSIVLQGQAGAEDKCPYIVDIKEMPWVSRQYLKQIIELGSGTARLTASRGCCANCSFCSFNSYSNKMKSRRWQGREIQDIYNEVIDIYSRFGIRSFTFNDGSFEDPGKLGKERIREFCNLIMAYPVKFHFWCFLRAETFREEDTELIKLMKKAGFSEVFIGVEAGNDADLKVYNKRATMEDNRRSIRLFEDNDINVLFGFIMFNPFSTRDSLRENYEFLVENNNWRPHAFAGKVALFYKTALHIRCENEGLLTENFSYLNPMGYRFKDPDIIPLWDFIENHLLNSIVFQKYDVDIFYFNNFFNDMVAIFPEEMTAFVPRYKKLMKDFAAVQAEYFKNLYVDYDLVNARQQLEGFEHKMSSIIKAMNAFKLSIIVNEPFKSFIWEVLGGTNKEQKVQGDNRR